MLALLNLTHFVSSSGYLAVFLLSILQSCCVPTSSELTFGFAGYLAATGKLSLVGVILVGAAGEVVGAYIAWIVGRYGGRTFVDRWGKYVLLTHHDLDRAEAWYDRHGNWGVFAGRLIPVIRNFVAIPAGVAEVPLLRFGILTAAGQPHLGRRLGPARLQPQEQLPHPHQGLQRRRLRDRRPGDPGDRLRDLPPLPQLQGGHRARRRRPPGAGAPPGQPYGRRPDSRGTGHRQPAALTGEPDSMVGSSRPGSRALSRQLRRVPEVTVWFWVAKLLTTAMGEALSDYAVHRIDPVEAVLLGGAGLVVALALQFRAGRYVPWIYWLTVAMVAVSGTMAADVLHIRFKVPYATSTVLFAVVLAVVFVAWYSSEQTLSIHSIVSTRREIFYWATVMATFALGTAAGDLTAFTLKLGFFSSGLLFAGLFAVPAVAYGLVRLNAILAFWSAYVMTRPLGASFADWTGKARSLGGLAWGDLKVSLGLGILLVLVVAYLTVSPRHRPSSG